jgi:hypothetical protein
MLWALTQRHFEIDESFRGTLGDAFDAPIFKVADETAE